MATLDSWFPAAKPPVLADHELHVWRATLDASSPRREQLQETLNSDEKRRAEKILVSGAREHFLVARGMLRELLGAYLGIGAAEVSFDYGAQGKPALSAKHNSEIRFNISHSHGAGLFVFAKNHDVGADIEYVRRDVRGSEIASHFFSAEEVARLSKLPPQLADEAFFGCWTRKEAYVKAHGEGLGIPLRSFSVEFTESKQILEDDAGVRWSCYALNVAPSFAAAVVAEGEHWNVKYCEWPGAKTVPASNTWD
jgi:4'-phosphopantetheinyl transferase